jgi:hypothetical protein
VRQNCLCIQNSADGKACQPGKIWRVGFSLRSALSAGSAIAYTQADPATMRHDAVNPTEETLLPKPRSAFAPYIADEQQQPELTARALLLGCFFGLVFGAVTVYVGLRAGLTVAASIPIAVLSISVLRALGRASILENNIVQTTGNAGQSIAAGVIFTLPALIFLGFDLEYVRIFVLALIGGWLGVFFMIPLRRQLIVEEHGQLAYPEGTACAEVRRFCQPRLLGTWSGRRLHAVAE